MSPSHGLNIHYGFKKEVCFLSDQRLLPDSIHADGHVWEEGGGGRRRIKRVRQIEVRGRSQPGERDKFSGHILDPLSGTLTLWKTTGLQEAPAGFAVPSAGQQRRGWPAMHDNYPHRDLLPSPSPVYPHKQERAQEVCSPEM